MSIDITGNLAQENFQRCLEAKTDLPPGFFFGATAATGGLSDNHDLFAFVTYSIGDDYYAQLAQKNMQPPPQQPDVLQRNAAQDQQQQQSQQQQQYEICFFWFDDAFILGLLVNPRQNYSETLGTQN